MQMMKCGAILLGVALAACSHQNLPVGRDPEGHVTPPAMPPVAPSATEMAAAYEPGLATAVRMNFVDTYAASLDVRLPIQGRASPSTLALTTTSTGAPPATNGLDEQ